jgi:transposase
MGRMLDTLYAAGVTEVFLEVAREARRAFPFPVRALHADATSFHVHGQYEGLGEEVGAIRVTYGYSPDHRPDLKRWAMNLVVGPGVLYRGMLSCRFQGRSSFFSQSILRWR